MSPNPDPRFPISESQIYLNHAAVSPLPRPGQEAIATYARECCEEGLKAFPRWIARNDAARREAATLLGADAGEIAFVKSTTHGLQIVANSVNWRAGDVIVVEEHAFPANWYVWKSLEERFGVRVVQWPERPDYTFAIEELEPILADHPVRMVALTAGHYATGFRHDLAAVGEKVKAAGALYCLDAIQVLGAVPVDVRDCRADFVSADGHKWLLGPEGCGVFYVRRAVLGELNDSMCGWLGREKIDDYEARNLAPHPEARRFEEGAPNHMGMHGLGAALAIFNTVGMEEVWRRIQANTRVLREGLETQGWRAISSTDPAHATGILAMAHAEHDPVELAKKLMAGGISLSSRRGFLRLAPHFYNSPEQMEMVVETIERLA
ncbi:MAG: aminotransferase class V-fold PLP-dependent enzyme [Sumerlaeia bacterium]